MLIIKIFKKYDERYKDVCVTTWWDYYTLFAAIIMYRIAEFTFLTYMWKWAKSIAAEDMAVASREKRQKLIHEAESSVFNAGVKR